MGDVNLKKTSIYRHKCLDVFSSIFVFFQLLVIVVLSMTLTDLGPEKQVSIEGILKDGMLVLFSISLVSSSIVDYTFENQPHTDLIKKTAIAFVPIMIISLSTLIYGLLYFKKDTMAVSSLTYLETIIIIVSYIFIPRLRTLLLYKIPFRK